MAPFFPDTIADVRLERVSPVEHDINPIAADTRATIAGVDARRTGLTNPKVLGSLVGSVAQVRRVVPQDVYTRTHPRRDEVPKIPLAQQDAVTMELIQ